MLIYQRVHEGTIGRNHVDVIELRAADSVPKLGQGIAKGTDLGLTVFF